MRMLPIALGSALAIAVVLGPAAVAQERAGRYVMSPAEGGGMLRLDTETGAVSLCRKAGEQWQCAPVQDQARPGEEVARLQKENAELKAEVRRLEEVLGLGPDKEKSAKPADKPPSGFPLPSEQDVDRALDYVERMFKKFRDRLRQLEGGNEQRQL